MRRKEATSFTFAVMTYSSDPHNVHRRDDQGLSPVPPEPDPQRGRGAELAVRTSCGFE
jgi:hypothetical protein